MVLDNWIVAPGQAGDCAQVANPEGDPPSVTGSAYRLDKCVRLVTCSTEMLRALAGAHAVRESPAAVGQG